MIKIWVAVNITVAAFACIWYFVRQLRSDCESDAGFGVFFSAVVFEVLSFLILAAVVAWRWAL